MMKRRALLDQILGQRPQQPIIRGYTPPPTSTPTTPVPRLPGGQRPPGPYDRPDSGDRPDIPPYTPPQPLTPPSLPHVPDNMYPPITPGGTDWNPYAGIAGFGNWHQGQGPGQYGEWLHPRAGLRGNPTRERATQIGLALPGLQGYQPFSPFGGMGSGLGVGPQDDLLRQLRLRAGMGA